MGSVIFKFIVGGIAGLLAWVVMEPFAPKVIPSPEWDRWEGLFMLLLGTFIGGAVGCLEGFTRGGKVHTFRGLLLGALFGMVGATLGASIGSRLVQMVFGSSAFVSGGFMTQVLARTFAFIPIGMLLGAAIGASSLTIKRAVQGLIGGAIGAAVSGATFDLIGVVFGQMILSARGQMSGEVGGPSRAVTAILLGAMIGLFIGLVERFSRSAWLRLTLGRNEGKEWSIDGPQTLIGRSEGSQVPLFGDPNVAPVHAAISRQNGQYIIQDGGSPIGTLVNGQRIQQALLQHGAQIQIGSFALTFLVKNQAAPVKGPETYVGQAYQPYSPMPQQMPVQTPQPVSAYSAPTTQFQTPFAGPAATSGFALIAMDGPLLGQRYPISGPTDIGRESGQISLAFDSASSRRHANVTPSPTGLHVTDLNSTNGTFVNGQRVSQASAAAGDTIKIGSTTFRIETN